MTHERRIEIDKEGERERERKREMEWESDRDEILLYPIGAPEKPHISPATFQGL